MNEEQAAAIKVEVLTVKSSNNAALMGLRMASPAGSMFSSASNNQDKFGGSTGGFSPCDKKPATIKEAKRARRSAIEKRSRLRRQEMLKRMKAEMTQLEAVHADMTKGKETGDDVRLLRWRDLRSLNDVPSTNELAQKYAKLRLVTSGLEERQIALQKLIEERDAFYTTVRSLSNQMQADEKPAVWNSGVPPRSSFLAKFRPFSIVDIDAFVRETYDEIERFTESNNFETTGKSFMGWTDKRNYDQGSQALQYSFTKQFPREDPHRIFMKSWSIFMDGAKFERMAFDGSVKSRFEVLQVLSDDMVIIRRDHRIPSFSVTFTSIQIMARAQTSMGYTVCMRTIASPEIKNALEPHEHLTNVFHWNHFNQLYDEYDNPAGCEIVAAGSITSESKLKSSYWLFELVCSVLRWEHACVAPLLLKQI